MHNTRLFLPMMAHILHSLLYFFPSLEGISAYLLFSMFLMSYGSVGIWNILFNQNLHVSSYFFNHHFVSFATWQLLCSFNSTSSLSLDIYFPLNLDAVHWKAFVCC